MATLQNYAPYETHSVDLDVNCRRFTGSVCIILFDTTGELKKQCIPGAPSEFEQAPGNEASVCGSEKLHVHVCVHKLEVDRDWE